MQDPWSNPASYEPFEPQAVKKQERRFGAVLWVLILIGALCLVWAITASIARAEPPEGLVPNPAIAQWFKSLIIPEGAWAKIPCCDVSDCRVVETRPKGNGLEAYIRKGNGFDAFTDGDNKWHDVPPEHILHRFDNPVGAPVACWHWEQILCFVEGVQT